MLKVVDPQSIFPPEGETKGISLEILCRGESCVRPLLRRNALCASSEKKSV